jgi:hypothetical protein
LYTVSAAADEHAAMHAAVTTIFNPVLNRMASLPTAELQDTKAFRATQ